MLRIRLMKNKNFLQIDSHDNLIVALQTLDRGSVVKLDTKVVELQHDIPAKHKFALENLETGDAAAVSYTHLRAHETS